MKHFYYWCHYVKGQGWIWAVVEHKEGLVAASTDTLDTEEECLEEIKGRILV